MKKQVIKLLQKQIDKLDKPDFDLEAWKSSAVALLTRAFGDGDGKVKQINELKIDYSSWALRDSNANYKPVEMCKKKGKSIIETAIDEIDTFGLPKSGDQTLGLEKFFNKEEIKILLSESGGRREIISKLKKKDLEKLVLNLIRV